jgi:hypothetical protein
VSWHRVGSGCLGAAAPVTGAAEDEYNLNVVDCNASVTVARAPVSGFRSSISVMVSAGGLGGHRGTVPKDKLDNGFSWPPPVLLGILRETQFLRYYSVPEANY